MHQIYQNGFPCMKCFTLILFDLNGGFKAFQGSLTLLYYNEVKK